MLPLELDTDQMFPTPASCILLPQQSYEGDLLVAPLQRTGKVIALTP